VDFPPYIQAKVDSIEFFSYLSFLLQFCPTVPSETELRARFAEIGVGASKPFDSEALPPEIRTAIEAGRVDGLKAIAETAPKIASAADVFGTREFMKNNYMNRAVGAKLGIYGNSREEAAYTLYTKEGAGKPLDGANGHYVLHFAKGELPPVHAFWSVTMSDGRTQLLVANPINRYLINSAMLSQLRRGPDGGLTLFIQHELPGKDREANWLPTPDGPIFMVLRMYWPKPAVLDGTWKAPVVMPAS
jgi:hypothetical protein